jgi:hypothetical protein
MVCAMLGPVIMWMVVWTAGDVLCWPCRKELESRIQYVVVPPVERGCKFLQLMIHLLISRTHPVMDHR